MQLIPDAAGTFRPGVPTGEPFRIEASTDQQNWIVIAEEEETLQAGGTAFSSSPQRFFRPILAD